VNTKAAPGRRTPKMGSNTYGRVGGVELELDAGC
jgi:hypothetical protein